MTVQVDLQNAVGEPSLDQLAWSTWATAVREALGLSVPCELTIRVVDAEESQALNHSYRGKPSPTNVLSFPVDEDLPLALPLLGDLVLCWPVIEVEAHAQDKAQQAHLAHLTVHGVLHLHGYDHETDEDADEMESLEIGILEKLGYANPYRSEEDAPT